MYIRSLFEANKHVTEPRQQRVRAPTPKEVHEKTRGFAANINGEDWAICEQLLIQPSTQLIIEETENLLDKWKHPDPYRAPTAPGGSKYERNLPVPSTERESAILDPSDFTPTLLLTQAFSPASHASVS